MRERLGRVPPEVYRSGPVTGVDEGYLIDLMIADAHDLVAHVKRCAAANIGLLLEMG